MLEQQLKAVAVKFRKKFYNQEESKLDLLHQLRNLRRTLHATVDRVLDQVSRRLQHPYTPYSEHIDAISAIEESLKNLRNKVEAQDHKDLKAKAAILLQMSELESAIDQIPLNIDAPLQPVSLEYNGNAIQQAILSCIKMTNFDSRSYEFSCEKWLITRQGAFDLRSGKKKYFKPQYKFPDFYSAFQLHHKLYVCGGEIASGEERLRVNDFFNCDERGRCEPLQPMKQRRNALSLTGCDKGFIAAIGGWDSISLTTVQQFLFSLNDWQTLPELNLARQWAGSCVVRNKTLFCFCGAIGNEQQTDSVQKLELASDSWVMLPKIHKLIKSCQLCALPVGDVIVLFGGGADIGYSCLLLTQQGELAADMSDKAVTPGYMCQDGAVVEKGTIYTTGRRKDENWQRRVRAFNLEKWSLLQ